MPEYPVATLPYASWAVTVTEFATPAVTGVGGPTIASVAAAPEHGDVRLARCDPGRQGVGRQAIHRVPAVTSVTPTTTVPDSPSKLTLGGKTSRGSLLVKEMRRHSSSPHCQRGRMRVTETSPEPHRQCRWSKNP